MSCMLHQSLCQPNHPFTSEGLTCKKAAHSNSHLQETLTPCVKPLPPAPLPRPFTSHPYMAANGGTMPGSSWDVGMVLESLSLSHSSHAYEDMDPAHLLHGGPLTQPPPTLPVHSALP